MRRDTWRGKNIEVTSVERTSDTWRQQQGAKCNEWDNEIKRKELHQGWTHRSQRRQTVNSPCQIKWEGKSLKDTDWKQPERSVKTRSSELLPKNKTLLTDTLSTGTAETLWSFITRCFYMIFGHSWMCHVCKYAQFGMLWNRRSGL